MLTMSCDGLAKVIVVKAHVHDKKGLKRLC